MKPIPIKDGRELAERYGYDQVVIVARKVGVPAGVGETAKSEVKGGEHVTTYGRDKANCDVAARIGDFFKHKLMGWPAPACDHRFEYAGVRYCDGTWALPGGSARQRYYAHVYFCSKCTETKSEPISDAGCFGRPRWDTFQKLEFGAVPGSPDQCGVPQRDR
jgi:hypothetical protein